MPHRTDVIYEYDGSFEGLMCCVFESFEKHEFPSGIRSADEPQGLLTPMRSIPTDPQKAARVYDSLAVKISAEVQELVRLAHLTCAPEKEMLILRFILLGFKYGGRVADRLTDLTVCSLQDAVRQLLRETHKFKGFVRFSAYGKVLAAVIGPKNDVLPLLATHFCDRLRGEAFMIYDETHKMALVNRAGGAVIVPLEEFKLPAPQREEAEYRRLWKQFYDTIAIEGRINPRCRMSFMPKRFWKNLTEFFSDEELRPDTIGIAEKNQGCNL